jgi:glycosyltransferase involved in cell wall biosynthesis
MQLVARGFRLWKSQGPTAVFNAGTRRLLYPVCQLIQTLRTGWMFTPVDGAEDNSRVTLYADDPSLYPAYSPRRTLKHPYREPPVRVSLVAAALNEADNAAQWVKDVLNQTRPPDEIIVVDTGSTDGTLDFLRELAAHGDRPFQFISLPGGTIARARNAAISSARFPLIAVTDFGCHLRSDWLEKIVAPFEIQPNTQVAGGTYVPVDARGGLLRHRQWLWVSLKAIDPQAFLPPGASIAFKKQAWEAAGRYPEWFATTGEDTFFDLELKRHGGEWAFVPEAQVGWVAPEGWLSSIRKRFKWAVSDGESGARRHYYLKSFRRIVMGGLLLLASLLLAGGILWSQLQPIQLWIGGLTLAWVIGFVLATQMSGLSMLTLPQMAIVQALQVGGFWAGARRQVQIKRRRLGAAKGLWFVLSGVPIDDTGGGSRCTQITLELLRQGYGVVFINQFQKQEKKDLSLQISHPNLTTFSLSDKRWQYFLSDTSPVHTHLACLVEFPSNDFLPIIHRIRDAHGIVAYDLMDDWDTSLGGQWYSLESEKEIIQVSHTLIATVPSLAERLRRLSGRPVDMLPNAVNRHLFNRERTYPRPADFPSAEWSVVYTGALWGEWFDWDLTVQVALQHPEAAVIVIGDYGGQCKNPPSNLYLPGLKPQRELPAYLAQADVAIIPWKINAITQATSPLKVYEYLAMGRPVVAPDIEPLRGMPGVHLATDARGFNEKLVEARNTAFPHTQVAAFVEENDWSARVNRLATIIDQVAKNKP